MRVASCSCLFAVFALSTAFAQGNPSAGSTSTAATVQSATQSVVSPVPTQIGAAFSQSGKMPSVVTLSGTVDWIAGSSKESGEIKLQAGADGSSEETWTLPSKSLSYSATAFSGDRTCTLTTSDGKIHSITDTSCLRPVAWFAPWLVANPTTDLIEAVSAQPEKESAGNRLLIQSSQLTPPASVKSAVASRLATLKQQASLMLTYDQATGLPSSLSYDQSVDNQTSHAVKISVVFSDYRPESGYVLPHHIQRYFQRTLQADIHISNVTVE